MEKPKDAMSGNDPECDALAAESLRLVAAFRRISDSVEREALILLAERWAE